MLLRKLNAFVRHLRFTKEEREKIAAVRSVLICPGVAHPMTDEQALDLYDDFFPERDSGRSDKNMPT